MVKDIDYILDGIESYKNRLTKEIQIRKTRNFQDDYDKQMNEKTIIRFEGIILGLEHALQVIEEETQI